MLLGETDWKILAIDITDPLADQINGVYYLLTLYIIALSHDLQM